MKLYSYWRSTTAYRVRIPLNLKGIRYDTAPVDLVAGDQRAPDYTSLNPSAGVPTLVLDDGTALTQSMVILDYLDAVAEPRLTPADPIQAAKVRAAALIVACDIHPVNNLKVVTHLKSLGHSQEEATAWMNHWMTQGFTAYQALIPQDTPFSFGDTPSLADLCLIPQLYNAHRWGCDLTPFGRLAEIEARCLTLPAFQDARPENQPDATPA